MLKLLQDLKLRIALPHTIPMNLKRDPILRDLAAPKVVEQALLDDGREDLEAVVRSDLLVAGAGDGQDERGLDLGLQEGGAVGFDGVAEFAGCEAEREGAAAVVLPRLDWWDWDAAVWCGGCVAGDVALGVGLGGEG